MKQISGFGPVAAQRLVEEHGVTSLEDLEKLKQTFTHHQRIGWLSFIAFFCGILSDVYAGLKYFHDFNQRIPRSVMIKLGVKDFLSQELIKDTDQKRSLHAVNR